MRRGGGDPFLIISRAFRPWAGCKLEFSCGATCGRESRCAALRESALCPKGQSTPTTPGTARNYCMARRSAPGGAVGGKKLINSTAALLRARVRGPCRRRRSILKCTATTRSRPGETPHEGARRSVIDLTLPAWLLRSGRSSLRMTGPSKL